jgi:hypothetical protein
MLSKASGGEAMKKSCFLEWHNNSKSACMSKSYAKETINAFFNVKGTGHFTFILQGQTFNKAYYVELLQQLCEGVCRKRLKLLPDLILHYNNAPVHRLSLSSSFWPKNRLPKWNIQPIPLIWIQMTSGCFQK